MQFPHDPKTMNPEPTAAPRRWLGRSLAAGVLVAVSVAVTACGSTVATTILNTEKVESAIEQSILTQRAHHAQVSCPSGVHQKKDLVFSCTAVIKRDSTRFVVTELDDLGHVHYEAR
ncbi:MAG: hypothetical protein QOI98_3710 [Solirubrobacteraceae bacterium]|jgi:galactitol-specific phosphotransferase system IIB component|nr:hypothetical protein [Solirubrobacteraceae bacterium]